MSWLVPLAAVPPALAIGLLATGCSVPPPSTTPLAARRAPATPRPSKPCLQADQRRRDSARRRAQGRYVAAARVRLEAAILCPVAGDVGALSPLFAAWHREDPSAASDAGVRRLGQLLTVLQPGPLATRGAQLRELAGWSVHKSGITSVVHAAVALLLRDPAPRMAGAAADALAQRGPAVLPALRLGVRAADLAMIRGAIYALVKLGPAAAAAVPDLARVLDHRDQRMRATAATALGRIGPQAAAAVPRLVRALSDRSPHVRPRAVWALGSIGPSAAPALAALRRLLASPRATLRAASIRALGKIGAAARPALSDLIALASAPAGKRIGSHLQEAIGLIAGSDAGVIARYVHHAHPTFRGYARRALESEVTRPGSVVDAFAQGLADPAYGVRGSVVEVLGLLDHRALSHVAQALQRDAHAYVRDYAMRVFERRSAPTVDDAIVQALGHALRRDAHGTLRARAAAALGKVGKRGLVLLLVGLRDRLPAVRRATARALAAAGKETSKHAATLVRALGDTDAQVRRHLVTLLGSLGQSVATTSAPGLEHATQDADPRVRAAAVVALSQLGQAGIGPLTQLLARRDPALRIAAAEAFGRLRLVDKPAVRGLVHALRSSNAVLRQTAAHALGQVDPPPVDAVYALMRRLRDGDTCVRRAVAVAIGRLGAQGSAAVKSLTRALRSNRASDLYVARSNVSCPRSRHTTCVSRNVGCLVRRAVATALGRIGPKAKRAVTALRDLLADKQEDSHLREEAARALGRIGPASRPAIPALVAAVAENHPWVTGAAATALAAMSAKSTPAVVSALVRVLAARPRYLSVDRVMSALVRLMGAGAIPHLRAVLHDPKAPLQIRQMAATQIVGLGPSSLPALRTACQGTRATERAAVAAAISNLATSRNWTVPLLIQILQAPGWAGRYHAAKTLAQLGTAARPAIAALKGALAEAERSACKWAKGWRICPATEREFRAVARDALRRIDLSADIDTPGGGRGNERPREEPHKSQGNSKLPRQAP